MIHMQPVTVFFFNDTATTEIYTLSLHDALPICGDMRFGDISNLGLEEIDRMMAVLLQRQESEQLDRKSTRLNSSHSQISYAVFCLKKKKIQCTVKLQSYLYI